MKMMKGDWGSKRLNTMFPMYAIIMNTNEKNTQHEMINFSDSYSILCISSSQFIL